MLSSFKLYGGDKIRCFHCACEIKNPVPEDDVNERHAKVSSKYYGLKNYGSRES